MRWSTRLSEKVTYCNLTVIHSASDADLLIGFNMVVALGEPHIDGEPGDLRFRIKVLKYDSVITSLFCNDVPSTTLI